MLGKEIKESLGKTFVVRLEELLGSLRSCQNIHDSEMLLNRARAAEIVYRILSDKGFISDGQDRLRESLDKVTGAVVDRVLPILRKELGLKK